MYVVPKIILNKLIPARPSIEKALHSLCLATIIMTANTPTLKQRKIVSNPVVEVPTTEQPQLQLGNKIIFSFVI